MSDQTAVDVPKAIQDGITMEKYSGIGKRKLYTFRIDPDLGQIIWQSTKKLRIIPIESIKELRSGSDGRYYREQFQLKAELEDRWLTMIYILESEYKTLHLVAPDRATMQSWDLTLRKLYAIRVDLISGSASVQAKELLWEKQYWKSTERSNDHRIDFSEVERLCKQLGVQSPQDNLQKLFKQADTESKKSLNFAQFQLFIKTLKTRPEIDRLYKSLEATSKSGHLDLPVFQSFLLNTQGSSLSQQEIKTIFDQYCATSVTTSSYLTLDAFHQYLTSTHNSAFTDQRGNIWQDMTRPLSEYFISSSHNTYLIGHQLVGSSTIEGYIRALLHSCRSVEMDIYDGENEPMVYHGKTLTRKVSVREICTAIAKYAFVASPYPVIISAEVHCSVQHQETLYAIMTEAFGSSLITSKDSPKTIENLPSPEELKGKVLLKAKNVMVSSAMSPNAEDTDDITTETSSQSESELAKMEGAATKKIEKLQDEAEELESEVLNEVKTIKSEIQKSKLNPFSRLPLTKKATLSTASVNPAAPAPALVATTAAVAAATAQPAVIATKPKMSMKLASLLVYTVGVKCRGLNKKEHYAPEHVFSLSENTINKHLKHGMHDLIKHTRSHLVRVYPKGTRVNSTNYEPHRYWSAGAQLVAINWQTDDLGFMINRAMFQRNGRSGYILKPSALRSSDKSILDKRTNHLLKVQIISAQQLPRPKDAQGREIVEKRTISPFVEVSVHIPDWTHSPYLPTSATKAAYSPPSTPTATSATSARTIAFSTSIVKDNGFNPVWDETITLPFNCVGDMKSLIFVKFAVKHEGQDSESDPLAMYVTSLYTLEQGYRHLPLHDSQMSQYLFSTLFVKVTVQDAGA